MKRLLLLIVIALSFTGLTFAHPGSVDSYWWHTCYTNCYLYWLYDWAYHYHIQTSTVPTSYVSYAPNWSCETERLAYQENVDRIKEIETQRDKTYNDLVTQYPLATTSELMVQEMKINYDLREEESTRSNNSNLLMTEYYACRSNAWYEEYKKQQQENEETMKQFISDSLDANTNQTISNSIVSNLNVVDSELENAIKWMYDNWLTNYGTISTFMWDDYITREQASKFFVMFAKTKWQQATSIKNNVFTDVKNANPNLYPYICVAYTLWIMNWSNNKFMPFNNLTPAQSIAMLIRITDWKLNEQWANRYTEYYAHANNDWLLNGLWFSLSTLDTTNIKRKDMALLLYRAR